MNNGLCQVKFGMIALTESMNSKKVMAWSGKSVIVIEGELLAHNVREVRFRRLSNIEVFESYRVCKENPACEIFRGSM